MKLIYYIFKYPVIFLIHICNWIEVHHPYQTGARLTLWDRLFMLLMSITDTFVRFESEER